MVENKSSVTRRGFLAGCGAGAAGVAAGAIVQSAFPWGSERVANPGEGAPLSDVRAWYEETIDQIVRRWEPRFRFRQYRRTDCDGGDLETRESPQDELSSALVALPPLQDEATACLVLALSAHRDDVTDAEYAVNLKWGFAEAMARDVLDHAERLGYFAGPCPADLRFPDLPLLTDRMGDVSRAEIEVQSAEWCEGIDLRKTAPGMPDEWYADQETRLERARAHLDAIRAGTAPALTERQKLERHLAARRAIVAAYRARLEAAGRDAAWVEIDHPCYAAERLREIEADEADAA